MILLCDIDHTLADASWRDPIASNESWLEYHILSQKDKPIDGAAEIVRALSKNKWDIYGITGRPERFRQITVRWLCEHSIPVNDLFMRRDDDYRPALEVKQSIVQERWPEGLCGEFVALDDREDIAAWYAEQGAMSMKVNWRKI